MVVSEMIRMLDMIHDAIAEADDDRKIDYLPVYVDTDYTHDIMRALEEAVTVLSAERQGGVEGFRRSYFLVDKHDLKYCPNCGAEIGVGWTWN